jgi:glycosyltransferase involved in cell wall biosynthesis
MKVAVVTPTIGSAHLQQCLDSVAKQTYNDVSHYVFVDGKQYYDAVNAHNFSDKVRKIYLEENIGKGWYGHRVYAACSFLVNADIICYLDEDNWFEPDHVENLVKELQSGKDWAFSLRKIYDKNGNYLLEDNCESLGLWPVYFNDGVFHIDTSSFAVRRNVAVQIGQAWYGQWGADRQFFGALKTYFKNYSCTKKHSLCYRLEGNEGSVTKEFFETGNEVMNKRYNGEFPWKK